MCEKTYEIHVRTFFMFNTYIKHMSNICGEIGCIQPNELAQARE